MSGGVALGTKVFTRTSKLAGLLDTVPDWISTVYIADDGEQTSKRTLYTQQYPFKLKVLNLEYDSGVGIGRNAIVSAVEEEYVIIVDPDHRIPPSMRLLYDQLRKRPELGGISGLIIEPDNNRLYAQAADFHEIMTDDGVKLLRKTRATDNQKIFHIKDNIPVVKFDFIPQATIFRASCLNEESWDPEFITEFEHTDFYLSHWKNTDWEFGICPSVQIPHYPGGNTEYMTNRKDPQKRSSGKEYFLKKWNYIDMETTDGNWIEAGSIGSLSDNLSGAIDIAKNEGVMSLLRQGRLYLKNNL